MGIDRCGLIYFFVSNMNNKEVFIVMPVYNWEKYIFEQLYSIYQQTFENRNLIIVNDWSKDNTLEIIEKFIKTFDLKDKVSVYTKENWWVNSAISYWLNKIKEFLWNKYDNKYIALSDADDIWMKNKLEEQLEFIDMNNCDFCYHDLIEIDKNNSLLNVSHLRHKHTILNNIYDESFLEFCTWQHITSTTMFYKSYIIDDIYQMPSIWAQDHWIVINISLRNRIIKYMDKKLWFYRVHSLWISHNQKSRQQLLSESLEFFNFISKDYKDKRLDKLIDLYSKWIEWEKKWYNSIKIWFLLLKNRPYFCFFLLMKPFKFIYHKIINYLIPKFMGYRKKQLKKS